MAKQSYSKVSRQPDVWTRCRTRPLKDASASDWQYLLEFGDCSSSSSDHSLAWLRDPSKSGASAGDFESDPLTSAYSSTVKSRLALLVVWLATDKDGPPSKLDWPSKVSVLRRTKAAKVDAEALTKTQESRG